MKRRKVYIQESSVGKVYHLGCLLCSQCGKSFSEDDAPKLANDGEFDFVEMRVLVSVYYLFLLNHSRISDSQFESANT